MRTLPFLLVAGCGFQQGMSPGSASDDFVPPDAATTIGVDAAPGSDARPLDAPPVTTVACHTDVGYVANPQTGIRYRAVSIATSWTAGQADCASKGAHLVVINDAAEDAHVDSLLASEIWIGYSDQAVEGTFVWVNGESPAYKNWRLDGNPNDGSGTEPQDCAEIDETGGYWNDDNCPELDPYVCECPP